MTNLSSSLREPDLLIFDLAPVPMWIYDLNTLQFLAVNKEAVKQYGYSEQEFLNLTIKDIRPPEDVPKLEKAVAAAQKRKEPYLQSLFRHQKRDGSLIYVQLKSNLITFDGKAAELVTAHDLTERRAQKEEVERHRQCLLAIDEINQLLLKSTNWLASLAPSLEVVGEALRVDRVYFFQNDEGGETTSQKLEWVTQGISPQLDHPELQNLPLSSFDNFLKPLQEGENLVIRLSELDNPALKEHLAEQDIKTMMVLPIMVESEFFGFVGIDDCKTERLWSDTEFRLLNTLTSNLAYIIKEARANERLHQSEARFKSLVQKGKDLIAIIDEEAVFEYVAPASLNLLGIPPDAFIGKSAFDYVHPDDAERLAQRLEEIKYTDNLTTLPFRFPDAEGNWRWLQSEVTNRLDDQGIKGIVVNTWEVTTEIQLEISREIFVELNKAIGKPGNLRACFSDALKWILNNQNLAIGEFWLVSEDKERIDLIATHGKQNKGALFYPEKNIIHAYEKGVGFPGHVWESERELIWENIDGHEKFVRSTYAAAANLKTAVGVPIFYNNEFLGCFVGLTEANAQNFSGQTKVLTGVISNLGAVVKQKITETEYRNFFDISPDPYCIIGFDGRIQKFNQAFGSFLGYHDQEIIGRSIFKFIHIEHREKAKKQFKTFVPGAGSKFIDAKFYTRNGDVKWLRWNGTIIEESKIILAAAQDITEVKLAEEKLSTAYTKLQNAQKLAKLGYWTCLYGSSEMEWGKETYIIAGCSPEEFTPTLENIKDLLHPDNHWALKANPCEHLSPGIVRSFEHQIFTPQGDEKWLQQEVRLVLDEKGSPLRVEGSVQDITERKHFEQELVVSNERFKLAMKASNEIIWEVDHATNTLTRSDNHQFSHNYSNREVFGHKNTIHKQIHPDDQDRVWSTLMLAINSRDINFWQEEYRIKSSGGSISYLIDRCYILRDENGKAIRTVGSVVDVTESRQQMERIKKQNENLREIAWIQSHVVRAPLARILGLINLGKDLDGYGMTMDELLEHISNSAHELDEVIREITEKTVAVEAS